MENIKVILTIMLPGATLLSEEEAAKVPQGKGFENINFSLVENAKRKFYNCQIRKSKPATQVIKMYESAYDYLTNGKEIPEWSNKFEWSSLSKNQRLKKHFERITNDLGGESFTFEVLTD